MELAWVALGSAAVVAVGVALAALVGRAARASERARALAEELERRRAEVAALSEERARLAAELAAERGRGAARAEGAERDRELLRGEIERLATRLLEEQGQAMLARSRDGLAALLGPLREKLGQFEQKVDRTYDQENRDRASLLESVRGLQRAQAQLHQDADGLARALTGASRAQGDWGELVLERALEAAGLREGREYALQEAHLDAQGALRRPDAVVTLPGDRALVVDAKCSLTAFVEASRAAADDAREAALDRHVASLRAHVRSLAGKRYPELLQGRTLDLVLMFVPTEAAFQAALARDPALAEHALGQGVVLVSPTTLLATLQVVAHVWRSERQDANARRIALEAGRLLDKLAAFVSDLDEVGSRLAQAQTAFEAARGKLASGRGNVLKRARDLAALGAQVKPDRARLLASAGAEAEPGEDGEEPPTPIAAPLAAEAGAAAR